MVDEKHIHNLLKKSFWISGSYTIDPVTGVVNVDSTQCKYVGKSYQQLPVQFGKVSGDFDVSYSQLTSLEGCPQYVGGNFFCTRSKLTNLNHAPVHVEGTFDCYGNPLTSLAGAPEHVMGTFRALYKKNLPVLRLLNYKDIYLEHAPSNVIQIIESHTGEGKAGALQAAAELIRAGYKENARW